MQLQVTNSPFNQEQTELLNKLLPSLSATQQSWLSGYLTALHAATGAATGTVLSQGTAIPGSAHGTEAAANMSGVTAQDVTILYGSQTGNSQKLAESVSRKLQDQGLEVTVSAMGDYKPNNLKKVNNLLVLVSTHGEGDPPDNAIVFHEYLHSKRAPKLDELRYSVLSLGDSSYEFFCQTGKDFDSRLAELGATRLSPRVDCDLDFDEPAAEWIQAIADSLQALAAPQATSTAAVGVSSTGLTTSTSLDAARYSKTYPFQAEVLENLNLNGRGSKRETRHLELSLEGSNLQYEPGDCLGILPENHPDLVDMLIHEAGLDAQASVPINSKGEVRALREALLHNYEITLLTRPLLDKIAQLTASDGLMELLKTGREQDLKQYIEGRDVLDVVQDYSLKGLPAIEFVSTLRKMPPRLYSIASSFKANPDEVHLTIRSVAYQAHGRDRFGVCSAQCADRLQPGDTLPVYIHQNPNFKLPADPKVPVIMIGPGTGVAPFRAFLEEREEIGAEGQTWLFFGDQHFVTDFLYQTDWQKWLKNDVLTRMDVAFSRDTDRKIYVQHRMMEKSHELYQWLEQGAYVYVCGDEKQMAHDVHAALIKIIEQHGGLSSEDAVTYVTGMMQQKRYQRDVY